MNGAGASHELTDYSETRLSNCLEIGHKLCWQVWKLTRPVCMDQLYSLGLLPTSLSLLHSSRCLLLLFHVQLSDVVLIVDFSHCFHWVVLWRNVELLHWGLAEEFRNCLASCRHHPIIARVAEDVLNGKHRSVTGNAVNFSPNLPVCSLQMTCGTALASSDQTLDLWRRSLECTLVLLGNIEPLLDFCTNSN